MKAKKTSAAPPTIPPAPKGVNGSQLAVSTLNAPIPITAASTSSVTTTSTMFAFAVMRTPR